MDLDGLSIKLQPFLFVDEELLDILALIALELNYLTHLAIIDDSAIAGKLLLDDLKNFFLVKFLGESLDRGQRLSSISLLDTYVYVVLRLLCLAWFGFGLGEGVERLEVFDS